MAETKKYYLDLAGLTHYDGKIKDYISGEITKVNNSVADYATTKDRADKAYTAWTAFLNNWPTSEVAPTLDQLAVVKSTVENLGNTHYTKAQVDAIVGTPTEGKTVVGMIGDLDTAYKSADETLGGRIKAIEDLGLEAGSTYAKAADLTALSGTVSGMDTAYKAADEALGNRVTAIENLKIAETYAKADDLTALSGTVSGMDTAYKAADEALGNRVTAIENLKIAETYAKAADLTALSGTVSGMDTAYKAADKAINDEISALKGAIQGGTFFIGVKDALPTEGMKNGDVVIVGSAEYIYDATQSKWVELGDTTAEAEAITALQNGKADKATTLAGYGIADAYTKDEVTAAIAGVKVSVVDAEGTYVDVKGSVDAAGRQITLSVDEQGLTDALAGKADKATTLAGYGITDAYTKGETYTKDEVTTAIAGVKVSVVDAEGTYVDVKGVMDDAGRVITLSVDEKGLTDALATKASNDALTTGLAGKTSMSVDADGNVTFSQGEITVAPITNAQIDALFA